MYLREAEISDCNWVYENLGELRYPVEYSEQQFKSYFEQSLTSTFFKFMIFFDDKANRRIGLVSLNKFYMPRYLGYGYEMEEFIIQKEFRGQGFSYEMILAVKAMLVKDLEVRKLIIKSNGTDSMHIYAKALNETDLKTFQVYLNKL